jgi:hypothetical protein
MLEKIKKNRRKIERYAIATAAGIAAVVIVKQRNTIDQYNQIGLVLVDAIVNDDKAQLELVKALNANLVRAI